MAYALGGGLPEAILRAPSPSLPVFPHALLSHWECSAPFLQEELPPGVWEGECLGLTPRGNESPGQPLHYPPLKLFSLTAMGRTPSGPQGLALRPLRPLLVSTGPAQVCDLTVHQSGNSGCPSLLLQHSASSRGSQEQRQT